MRDRIVQFLLKYAILVVVLVMCIFFAFNASNFFTYSNIISVLRQGSITCIVAVGNAIILMGAGIDLSVGTGLAFIGMVCALSMINYGVSVPVAMLLGVLVGLICGLINGLIVTKLKVIPMIATLATTTIFTGFANIVNGGLPAYGFDARFKVLGQGHLGPIPIPVIIMVLALAVGTFFMEKTFMGRHIMSVGSNEEAARLAGLNVNRIKLLTYIIGGFFTGVAGIILLGRTGSASPQTGAQMGMDVLTACVIGGISMSGGEGKVYNAAVGVFALQILANGMVLMNIHEYYQNVISGVVLIAAVSLDMVKTGRLGKKPVVLEVKDNGTNASAGNG